MLTVIKPPKLKRDMVGKRVRTKRDLSNKYATVQAGTLALITGFYRGLELRVNHCSGCGIVLNITRVPYNQVEFIEEA